LAETSLSTNLSVSDAKSSIRHLQIGTPETCNISASTT
jgi:hypothetical protein